MFKLILFFTGILSFFYFLKPNFFTGVKKTGEKVLGLQTINQAVNIDTVKTALTIFCINKQTLPKNLNSLYGDELSRDKYLDLDATFSYTPGEDCSFTLKPK